MLATFERLAGLFYDWLSCPDSVCNADLICALAGRRKRMIFAMQLFSQGRAQSVLLSVGPYESGWGLPNLPWPVPFDFPPSALSFRSPEDHWFVTCEAGRSAVDKVEIGKFGTLGEIRTLAHWLQSRPQIASLLVVSSAPHLRRVRMCCRALLPQDLQVRFLAVPYENPFLNRELWWKNPRTRAIVISELPKLLLYSIIVRKWLLRIAIVPAGRKADNIQS